MQFARAISVLPDHALEQLQSGRLTIAIHQPVHVGCDRSGVIVTAPGKKGRKKIRVEYDPDYKGRFPFLRVGAAVTVRGKCAGSDNDEIDVIDAWFAP